MDLLTKTLKNAKENALPLDVYRDNIDDETVFGKVLSVTAESVAIGRINDEGQYDGISFIRKTDITRVSSGGTERKALAKLAAATGADKIDFQIKLPSKRPLRKLIDELTAKYKYLTFFTEELDRDILFIGKVLDHDNDFIQVSAYGTMSSLDKSELLLRLDDITRIDVDTIYSNKIVRLVEENSKAK